MSYHILLVDDDRFFHTMVAYALRDKQDRLLLTTCLNLAQARHHIAAHDFDAILLDFQLPDGEGPDLIPHIKPTCAILLLSGLDEHTLSNINTPRIQHILNKHEMSPHSLQSELLGAIQSKKLSLGVA